MNMLNGIGITVGVVLLTACASSPKTEKVTAANGSSISLYSGFASNDMNNNKNADVKLREHIPAQASASMC